MARVKESKVTHKLWRKRITCNGKGSWHLQDKTNPCGNNITIDERDIRKRGSSYYGIICPFCKSFNEVAAFELPERVKEKAMKI